MTEPGDSCASDMILGLLHLMACPATSTVSHFDKSSLSPGRRRPTFFLSSVWEPVYTRIWQKLQLMLASVLILVNHQASLRFLFFLFVFLSPSTRIWQKQIKCSCGPVHLLLL